MLTLVSTRRTESYAQALASLVVGAMLACSEAGPDRSANPTAGGAAGTLAMGGSGGSGSITGGRSGGSFGDAGAPSAGAPASADAAGRDAPPSEPSVHADLVQGGYDRLVIAKRDDARGLCFRVTLASPQYAGAVDVEVPKPWVAESVSAAPTGVGCRGLPASNDDLVLARSAIGRVTWPGARPCQVSVDVQATFLPTGHVHAEEKVVVDEVIVAGCP